MSIRHDETASGIQTFGIPINETDGSIKLSDLRELVEATATLTDAVALIYPAELRVEPREPDA